MKNELIIRTRHKVYNEKLAYSPEYLLPYLKDVTLEKIMNEIEENGMELLDQRLIDNPYDGSQIYETNLVIMKTSEYQRLKAIEKEFNAIWRWRGIK